MITRSYNKRRYQSCINLIDLPADIMFHIFSFIDLRNRIRLCTVCRSMNTLEFDPSLWRNIYLQVSILDWDYREQIPQVIIKNGSSIKKLQIEGINDDIYRSVFCFCKNLEELKLISLSIKELHVQYYMRLLSSFRSWEKETLPCLKKFEIMDENCYPRESYSDYIEYLGKRSPNLHELHICVWKERTI